MAAKQAQALERLLTKLSAIRKTLRGEERRLLDAMVLSAQSEVTAHAIKSGPMGRRAPGPDAARVAKADSRRLPDVELHVLKMRNAPSIESQRRPKAAPRNDAEVELHGFKPRTAPAAEGHAQGAAEPRIAVSGGSYRIIN